MSFSNTGILVFVQAVVSEFCFQFGHNAALLKETDAVFAAHPIKQRAFRVRH